MKIKQLTAICLALILIACLFAACSKTADEETTTDAAESLVIDLNRVIGGGEEESRTIRLNETTTAAVTIAAATTTAPSTSTTATASTTAPVSTTAAATAAVTTTAAQTTAAPTTEPTTVPATDPTTKAPETPTAKTLSAVQTAWKNIASSNRYVSQQELINALGGVDEAYQTASANGCTNTLKPGSVYIYGDTSSTNIQIITSLDPEEVVYQVDLKDDTYATPEGLSVGDGITAAKQLYGAPDREENGLLIFNQNNTYSLNVNYNANDVITGISLLAKD